MGSNTQTSFWKNTKFFWNVLPYSLKKRYIYNSFPIFIEIGRFTPINDLKCKPP